MLERVRRAVARDLANEYGFEYDDVLVWMQKKGFSPEDAFRAQYALLTSKQTPAEAWKEIKNYLEV